MTNLDETDDFDPIADALDRLHRAGWSVADVTFHDGAGGQAWIVVGFNGAGRIRTDGATQTEAWFHAIEQARSLGKLGT